MSVSDATATRDARAERRAQRKRDEEQDDESHAAQTTTPRQQQPGGGTGAKAAKPARSKALTLQAACSGLPAAAIVQIMWNRLTYRQRAQVAARAKPVIVSYTIAYRRSTR